jgi:hypothetical protein
MVAQRNRSFHVIAQVDEKRLSRGSAGSLLRVDGRRLVQWPETVFWDIPPDKSADLWGLISPQRRIAGGGVTSTVWRRHGHVECHKLLICKAGVQAGTIEAPAPGISHGNFFQTWQLPVPHLLPDRDKTDKHNTLGREFMEALWRECAAFLDPDTLQ